jgi:carbamate kinase
MGTPQGPAVLAFGGNALLPDPFNPEGQEERARDLARSVMLLLESCSGLVLVHGNGPQVGMILLRSEGMSGQLPSESLDVLVAETQGSIGYLLSRALRNALRAQGSEIEVTSILSQVVVDCNDPAFENPAKPIGPFYTAQSAEFLQKRNGWHMVETPGEGWRRVVPSPVPLKVVEFASIAEAAHDGQVVIAGGGGGVPVCDSPERGLYGVEAVIDKDRTASLLAVGLEAETFAILTGVPHVIADYGTPSARRLAEIGLDDARKLLEQGTFPPGSMGPKIESICDYIEATGRSALITDSRSLRLALEGHEGTWIRP